MSRAIPVEEFGDGHSGRDELVAFLASFENETRPPEFWRARLKSWWEANPAFTADLPMGWVLRDGGAIAGFLGVIASDYARDGMRYKALTATTWRVAREFRHASLSLYLRFYETGSKFILLNTTPIDKVERILKALKFESRTVAEETAFAMEVAGIPFSARVPGVSINSIGPKVPDADCRILSQSEDFVLRVPHRQDVLAKEVSPASLNWYCFSGPYRKELAVKRGTDGIITAYAVLARESTSGVDALGVSEYGGADADVLQVLAHISRRYNDGNAGLPCALLLFRRFGDNEGDIRLPDGFVARSVPARHYFHLPETLRGTKTFHVLAEGDVGL